MGDMLTIERDPDIAVVSLDNPAKMNALTLSMWRDLGAAMNRLSDDDGVRCIVLRGAGSKAFAAGADIGEFATLRSNREQARAYAGITTAAMEAIEHCRHPVVAMIHGVCVGGGLEIASLCDIRICGESSPNQRGRGGTDARGSIAITSTNSRGPTLRSRLCVPMRSWRPPPEGSTPRMWVTGWTAVAT